MKNEEEYYIKNNICPMCEGEIYFRYEDKHFKQEVKCVCEDGTYIGYLIHWELSNLRHSLDQLKKEHNQLKDWVKETSQCKTCGGEQRNTYGLCECVECGIPGTGFWPG